jgi:uncharacterized protein (UPF0371 family)
MGAPVDLAAQIAVEKLIELVACEVHRTHIPTPRDDAELRKLGANLTSDPDFSTKCLFERSLARFPVIYLHPSP